MFGKKKKRLQEEIKKVAEEARMEIEQVRREAEESCAKSNKAVNAMEMKMRQYDMLMEMDHTEGYIDPVTGKVNPLEDFRRNKEIYHEQIKDTGSPFL